MYNNKIVYDGIRPYFPTLKVSDALKMRSKFTKISEITVLKENKREINYKKWIIKVDGM